MEKPKLILVDPKPDLCAAWKTHFDGLPDVEIVNGQIGRGGDLGIMFHSR